MKELSEVNRIANNFERRITQAGLKKRPSLMLRLMDDYIKYCRKNKLSSFQALEYQKILDTTDDFRYLAKNFNNKYEELAMIDFYHQLLYINSPWGFEVQDQPNICDFKTVKEFINACEEKVKKVFPPGPKPLISIQEFKEAFQDDN
jgi:hypothetical protein